MQKTASKVKTETKVVVSTESESTFEVTTASEIHNPNEEIALTYIYSKLQRQYEIMTSLAEIRDVIMIAEPVPAPGEITNQWIKKYDWIIAKVLLDDSFREALSSITQELESDDLPTTMIDDVMNKAKESIETLAKKDGSASMSNIDVIKEAQIAYRESHKENLEKRRNRKLLMEKQKRLREHIRENIFHYYHAIWSHENPQQKLLRYRRLDIKVPLEWQFVFASGGTVSIDDLLTAVQDGSINIHLDGEFEPIAGSEEVDIADLINPGGPIGFDGNYAIYYIRPEYSSENIFDMLHCFKTPYVYYENGEAENPQLMDPYLIRLSEAFEGQGPKDEDEKLEMVQYVPELRLYYTIAKSESEDAVRALLNDEELFKKYYSEYLFRKEQSRRFLLETNNLMIDILPGHGSALEQFKLIHRGIDVLKANEEKEQLRLEKERRQKLLDANKFDDPDVERVVIVENNTSGTGQAVAAAAASQSTSNP